MKEGKIPKKVWVVLYTSLTGEKVPLFTEKTKKRAIKLIERHSDTTRFSVAMYTRGAQ